MSDSYPKREPFYAHRFVRLITKTAAAQHIGPEACWLLSIIAHQEDAIHYRHPIRYWNEQLGALCGFGSRKRLVSARRRAVDAGWLVYREGGKGRPGVYWVEIPPEYQDLPDGPCDESGEINCRSDSSRKPEQQTESRSDSSRRPEQQAPANRNGKGSPFNPTPTPPPTPKKRARSSDYTADFLRWWETYPRKIGKAAAARAYAKALAALKGEHNGMADAWLLEQTAEFARSDAGQAGRFTPHPATWLNQERFNDDPTEWTRRDGHAAGPGQRHPDDKPKF